jgi:hypothetical protein
MQEGSNAMKTITIEVPDWAQYKAQSLGGIWRVYSEMPWTNSSKNSYRPRPGSKMMVVGKGARNENWQDTLARVE